MTHIFISKNYFKGDYFIKPQTKKPVVEYVNENLPDGKFLVIDQNGQKLGIFERNAALKIAENQGLDIVMVSPPGIVPMTAKLQDYGKVKFDQAKRDRENKKNQKIVKIKEVKLSPVIDKHDFDTKLKHAIRFIKEGDKVKISLRFRGRMITHKDIGLGVVNRFIESLGEVNIETKPKLEGNTIIAVVTPLKNINVKKEKE